MAFEETASGIPRMSGFSRVPLPEDDKHGLGVFLSALGPFAALRDYGSVTVHLVQTFLLVAQDEGRAVNEYAERAGVSKSVMSRHILDLSVKRRNQGEGFNLLMSRPSPLELRRHEVYLTAEGKALAHKVLRALKMLKS